MDPVSQESTVGTTGGLDVKKILGAQQVVTQTLAAEAHIPAAVLGDPSVALVRIRFESEDATYEVDAWDAVAGTFRCHRVS